MPAPVLPAPRDPEALLATTPCHVSVLQTQSGREGTKIESRLSTPSKNEAASTHCCDDEGKEDDRSVDRHRASEMFLRRGLSLADRQETSSLANAVEDGQTEDIFKCRARIVASGHRRRNYQSQTKQIEGWRNFRRGKKA